jgi:hypothetical protein
MQPRRVRVADIERLQRTMETAPEHRVEEVTTMQAVRMLSSQIQGMQAKGYGLPAIAELLSENGVVVTPTTLKTYLNEARAAGKKKSRGKTKPRPGTAIEGNAAAQATGSKTDIQVNAASRNGQQVARGVAKAAPSVTAPPTAATTTVTKGTARPGDAGSTRRSAFVPKEDTRDI